MSSSQAPTIQERQTSKLALASFVLGIPGVLLIIIGIVIGNLQPSFRIDPSYITPFHIAPFVVLSISSFICGIIAVNKIGKSTNLKGTGLAITGLIEASVIIIPGLIALFIVVALYLHLYVT